MKDVKEQESSAGTVSIRRPNRLHRRIPPEHPREERGRECAADVMAMDTPELVSAAMETGIQVIQSSMTATEPAEALMR